MSPLVQTLGRLHVAMVHFPIALLMLAGVLEAWRLARRKKDVSPTVATCAILGALATVVAAIMGWILAASGQYDGDTLHTLTLHRWMGVATAGLAVVTALMLVVGKRKQVVMRGFTVGALGCAAMVGLTGHFGGQLTYGSSYLTELLFPDATDATPTEPAATQPTVEKASLTQTKVDYEKDVRPILDSTCVECHGQGKTRGGLKLTTGSGILKGGTSGMALVAHEPDKSTIIRRVMGLDGKKRMPLEKPALTDKQIAILRAWITEGGPVGDVKNEKKTWEVRLEPRDVKLPPGEGNPVDRILAGYLQAHKVASAGKVVEDRVFARRAYLDVIGMLPTVAEQTAFEQDASPDKREHLVDKLLADDRRYAENWMTFWDDALRNDYAGPGYIDGGRKAITTWLYEALKTGMPYDKFVTQLVDPVPGSEGFTKGIEWRGAVSASQVPELQASQNISQVFLGINMKCASCHDSFISDWKLADAYGLAGVYADKPMKMYRCETDQGKTAEVKFLYPQLGTIDGNAPKAQRLAQLAKALTCKEDGRFARTIVNRLWERFMGHGIVEPLDEMDNEPWNSDLLDWLSWDLANNGYDLKRTIKIILTSKAYQMPAVGMAETNSSEFVFNGPIVKRMSAEEFVDAVSELTGVWHQSPAARPPEDVVLGGRWIWNRPDALTAAPVGTIYLRKEFTLDEMPTEAVGAATCDNGYVMYINGKRAMAGVDWQKPGVKKLIKFLVRGKNVIAIAATNDPSGNAAHPEGAAALWALVSLQMPGEKIMEIGTDATWMASADKPADRGWMKAGFDETGWKAASDLGAAPALYDLMAHLAATNQQYTLREGNYRAVWAKNDRLMTALGRPTREQTVTYRQSAATTLQMLEMTNGPELFDMLKEGAKNWTAQDATAQDRVEQIYQAALGRAPTAKELAATGDMAKSEEGVEDLLWAVVMLPEFQLEY
ncbi:MAG TPA: DUF1549 domain-containing protein [Tepidisphaeraceae bacterium]|jgi:uncharacterized membrane protein|nr:DUF1549 domain-containing protein [Tepidisphaeraceae bacterium]